MAESPASIGSHSWRARTGTVLSPAADGLRMYPGSATTIGLLVGLALMMTIPVAWLTSWQNGEMGTTLPLETVAATGAIGPNYVPAAIIEHTALVSYFRLLGATAVATLIVALLSALGLAAARASRRTGEIVIRRAVGAGRRLLYAGLLAEGLVLAAITLLLGTGGAGTVGRLPFERWPDGAGTGHAPMGAMVALSTGILLVVGLLLPVIFSRRQALGDPEARPVPLLLPSLQLGFSLIVLVAGGLLARHATALLQSGATISRTGIVYRVTPEPGPRSAVSRSYQALLARVISPAGVSLASPGTVVGTGPTNRITTDCGHCMDGTIPARFLRVTVTQQIVSADSFHALGVPVLSGRPFTAGDSLGAPLVAIVSKSVAQSYFQNGQPLGRMLRIQEGAGVGREEDEWFEVVGIVDDRVSEALGGGLQPVRAIYLSTLQRPPAAAELLLRSDPAATPVPQVEAAMAQSLGAGARLARTTVSALIARESQRMSWFGLRFEVLGLVMLVIAAAGTAASMRSWVVSLRPELGLRRAVGATERQLLRLLLGRACLVGAAGTCFGIWFGPAFWDALGGLAVGLKSWDPELVTVLAVVLFGATLGGVALPAWKATRTAPAELLDSAEE
jgi:putative ABC transport system permease protein